MSEQTEDDQLNAIKDKAGEQYNFQELHINRVPDPAVGKLQDLAYEMFAGDYGATLAYLLELHELREQFDEKLAATNRKVVELEDTLMKMQERESESSDESSDVNTLQ